MGDNGGYIWHKRNSEGADIGKAVSGKGGNGSSYSGGVAGGSAIRNMGYGYSPTNVECGSGNDFGGLGGISYSNGANTSEATVLGYNSGITNNASGGLLVCYAGDTISGNGTYTSKGGVFSNTEKWACSTGGGSINLFAKNFENKDSITWNVDSPVAPKGGSRRKRNF